MKGLGEAVVSWLSLVAFILLAFLPAVAQKGVSLYGDASAYWP